MQSVVGQGDPEAFALEQALGHAAHGDRVVHDQHQWRQRKRSRSRGSRRGTRNLSGIRCLGHCFGRVTVHRGQCHRVINKHHRTRRQHRHTGQPWQMRQLRPQILDHNFPVAEHFIHMQSQALPGTAEHRHRQIAGGHFQTASGDLQQGATPEERNFLTRDVIGTPRVRLLHGLLGRTQHGFNQVGWHTNVQFAQAQHHHLRHGRGQGQYQPEGGALVDRGLGLHFATQGVQFGQHHVHADATT